MRIPRETVWLGGSLKIYFSLEQFLENVFTNRLSGHKLATQQPNEKKKKRKKESNHTIETFSLIEFIKILLSKKLQIDHKKYA